MTVLPPRISYTHDATAEIFQHVRKRCSDCAATQVSSWHLFKLDPKRVVSVSFLLCILMMVASVQEMPRNSVEVPVELCRVHPAQSGTSPLETRLCCDPQSGQLSIVIQ